jgi:hypothetical protein
MLSISLAHETGLTASRTDRILFSVQDLVFRLMWLIIIPANYHLSKHYILEQVKGLEASVCLSANAVKRKNRAVSLQGGNVPPFYTLHRQTGDEVTPSDESLRRAVVREQEAEDREFDEGTEHVAHPSRCSPSVMSLPSCASLTMTPTTTFLSSPVTSQTCRSPVYVDGLTTDSTAAYVAQTGGE